MENQKQQKKKSNKIKAVLILISSIIILIIMLITMFCTIVASNLSFLKYKFYVMEATSQPYVANHGDFIITKNVKPGEVQKGDCIVFGGKDFYYCDEVVETRKVNRVYKMVIAEKDGIKYQFDESEIEGKIVNKIPHLGNIVLFLRTPLGILFFIIFLVCVFALFRILLVSKYSYEEKDEDSEIQNNDTKEINNNNNEKIELANTTKKKAEIKK